jgi:hypothetical protein
MVKYRSENERSRTGIHGGVRRGSAAAVIGAVLVLTAGVPASQAVVAAGSDDPDVQVAGGVQLPAVGGLLQGVLGDAGTAPASPPSSPTPETTTTSTSPVPATAVPASPAPPPTTLQPPATGAAATGTTTPVPATTAQGSISTTSPLQLPEASAAEADVAGGAGADTSAVQQPAAEDSAPTASALLTTGAGGATAAPRTGFPQAVGRASQNQQQMTPQAEQAAEAAKVWLGVGLVGSAGAAGLVFTRIRRF